MRDGDIKRPFGIGWVLGRSLQLWARNLPVMLPCSALAWGLVILGTYSDVASDNPHDVSTLMTSWPFLFWMCNAVFGSFGEAAITYKIAQELRGQPVSVGAALGRGLRRFIPTLWMNFVVWFCIGVGLTTLFVPALFLYALFYVAVPASVVERPGSMGSLNRSQFLTDGYKFRILVMWFLLGAVFLVVNVIIFRALGLHGLTDAMDSPFEHGHDIAKLKIFLVLSLVWHIAFGLLQATVAAVTYATLRDEKDGTSTDELGQIFA